jgi:hypothetical protein
MRALNTGELDADLMGRVYEDDSVLVAVFFEWAKTVKLPRVVVTDQIRQSESEVGAYSYSLMDVAHKVRHRHYRLKSQGGTLDLADPSTHPHPDDVKQTIRDLGVTVKAQIDLIYKMVRDPNISPGRRRKNKTE